MADSTSNAIHMTVGKLLVVVVGMFAFVFVVMVPLYDVLCEALGLNGKTSGERYQIVQAGVDTSRQVRVQFVANHNEEMPWQFQPGVTSVTVHPGEPTNINYHAMNPRNIDMVAQAIPSVVPSRAAAYFHKTECFCFNQQALAAGESTDLGLQFIVDRDLPADIKTITLSYTIFDVTDRVAAAADAIAAR